MRSSKISAVLIAILALIAVLVVPAQAAKHGRPHGISITCGHHKCHKKHHCKRGKGHKKHKCRGHSGRRHHTPVPVPPSHPNIPKKTGPFCDPHVWVTPPNPEECEPSIADGPGLENTAPPNESPSDQKLEVKEVEVFEAVGFKQPATIYGCAKTYGPDLYGPDSDAYTITFYAKYGDFASEILGGASKYESVPTYCGRYIPPCKDDAPDDGYDEAWVVIYNHTKGTSVESERVKFNIEEPENVRYPVG